MMTIQFVRSRFGSALPAPSMVVFLLCMNQDREDDVRLESRRWDMLSSVSSQLLLDQFREGRAFLPAGGQRH